MSNEYYKIYQEKNIQLSESLFIHSALIPRTMNRFLEELGYSIDEDPMTWKYYHNIAGEYHYRDIPMMITSHDTLEEIEFTKDNLLIHKGTYADYKSNIDLVRNLEARYPDQSILIRGILDPIDPSVAVSAKDGTILTYDSTLIEDNEIDLLPELQDWIFRFFRRRNVDRHALVDDLAAAAFFGLLYALLPSAISNIRKSKCLTRQVHSYHVREYLRSHGELDRYMDVMNLDQRLYVYKNVLYILKNAGKQSTLDDMVLHLMTSIGLPLTTYDLKHNRLPDGTDTPDVYFLRRPLNYIDVDQNDNRYEIGDVLDRQVKVAPFNIQWQPEEDRHIHARAMDANNELRTKVLESDMLDIGEASPYILERSLIDYWFYLSSLDLYDTFVTIPSPTGTEDLSMSVKDAAILALYCAYKAVGIEPNNIPVYNLKAVRRITVPTWEQVRGVADRSAVSDAYIDLTLNNLVGIEEYNSVPSFRAAATQLHTRLQWHRTSIGYYGNPIRAVSALNAINTLYLSKHVILGNGLYNEWLSDRSIVLGDLDTNEYALLYKSIVKECIGTPDDERTLADIQKGIVALISQLSSYNVQFITKINESPIVFGDRIGISVTEYSMGLGMHDYLLRNEDRYPGTHLKLSANTNIINTRTMQADINIRRPVHQTLLVNSRTITTRSKRSYHGALYTNQRIVLY